MRFLRFLSDSIRFLIFRWDSKDSFQASDTRFLQWFTSRCAFHPLSSIFPTKKKKEKIREWPEENYHCSKFFRWRRCFLASSNSCLLNDTQLLVITIPPPPNRVSYLLCCFFFCRFNFFPNGGSTLWARFVLACGNVFAFFLLWKVGFSRFQFQNQCYTMLLDTASVSVVMTPDEFNTDFLSTFLTF